MRTALTIAGSDSIGGAGIQADLKTFTVLGVYGMSVVTAITAQNTLGVGGILSVGTELIREQLDRVATDIRPDATKTGMLATVAAAEVVRDGIDRHRLANYVCDPVMYAKGGDRLVGDDVLAAIRSRLLPVATVVTPNLREAEALAGMSIRDRDSLYDAARRIRDIGAAAVVIKGFRDTTGGVSDLLYDGTQVTELPGTAHPAGRNHGSGCAFSAAITAGLAVGMTLLAAVERAKALVSAAIETASLGRGISPVNVMAYGASVGTAPAALRQEPAPVKMRKP